MTKKFIFTVAAWLALVFPETISSYHQANEVIHLDNIYLNPKDYAFNQGEKITMRVHYGFITAGDATFEVDWQSKFVKDLNCFMVKGYGKSASSFDWFFPVRDTFFSYINKETLLPVKYYRAVHEGGYHFVDEVEFQQEKKVISQKGEFQIKEKIHDMLSCLYSTRCIDLSSLPKGKLIKVRLWLDSEQYELGFKILGKENLKTPLGTFKSIKIQPLVVADRVFKDTDGMKLWVTDDRNYIPLRVESPILVGSVKADIKDIRFQKYPLTSKIK